MRVLVIEDEPLIALMLETMVEDAGHTLADGAGSVAAALDRLTRVVEVEAAVLDVNLQGASSRPVAEALRRRDIAFVVVSGYRHDQVRALGFDEPHVRKPVRERELVAALAGLDDGGRH